MPLTHSCGPRRFRSLLSQPIGKDPHGLVSTLFHHMYSWPFPEVQVVLQAIVQVWQAIHLLISKTAAICFRGLTSSYQYSMYRPSCQLYTFAIFSFSTHLTLLLRTLLSDTS